MKSIEELIRQAIEEGKFDELPGKGQPFNMDENPYEDPEWRLAYRMLASSGFTLPWLETRREIEADLESARLSLRQARNWRASELRVNPNSLNIEDEWKRSVARFQSQIESLNKRITSFNLEAPNAQFQLKKVNAIKEIQELMSNQSNIKEN